MYSVLSKKTTVRLMFKSITLFTIICCLFPFKGQPQTKVQAKALLVTKGLSTEREKATAIAKWIGTHIRYDVKRYLKCSTKRYAGKKILRRKKALCDEYSKLFRDMCASVGITTYVVQGYTKDIFYDVNDPFYRVDHAWNAVFIDGKWYLADITFSSGSIQLKPRKFINKIRGLFNLDPLPHKMVFYFGFNDDYLFNRPEKFMFNHFPADPAWYLCNAPTMQELESDSNYFHTRHRPDVKNLHDEEGKNCPECMSKKMQTPYEHHLEMGPVTAAYNKKQEEYLVTTYAVRADSVYRYVYAQYKQKNYAEDLVDSLDSAAMYYRKSIDTLRSHGKNIRVEYKYKIEKEKKKLARCKKQNQQVRYSFQQTSSKLKSWNTYARNRIIFLKNDEAAGKYELRLPDNTALGPKEKTPVQEVIRPAFEFQKKITESITMACARNEKNMSNLQRCFEKASLLSGHIYVLSDSIINYRLSYHDELKKVYLRCKKAYLDSVKIQLAFLYDSLNLYTRQYKEQLLATDSLKKTLLVCLKKNYIISKQVQGSNPRRSDSLGHEVFNDFEKTKAILSDHNRKMRQWMENGKESTRLMMRKIYTQKRYLNTETKAERQRARSAIRHYNNDRKMRSLINKRVEAGLYIKKGKTHKLQQEFKAAINKEKTKRTGK